MKRPLCIVCLAFVVSIALLMQIVKFPSFSLEERDGNFVKIKGTITKKQTKEENLSIYLSKVTFCDELNFPNPNRNVICYLKEPLCQNEEPKMGSIVEIEGKAENFRESANPGEFDQKKFQMAEGYDFVCKDAKIVAKSIRYDKKAEFLYQVKEKLARSIDSVFSESAAGIIKAMLLGEKQEIDVQIKELYQRNGIAHILAISGLHIGIIGMAVYHLLRKLQISIPISSAISIFLIYHYGIMTGMSSSSYRAIIMFAIHLFAMINRRTYDMVTAMALAAVFLLLLHPFFLYQVGFLLSFGAIMGIGILQPALFFHFKRMRLFLAGISINLITLPILLLFYYEFPTYSIFLNLLIVPCMTCVVGTGSLAALAGLFSVKISRFLSIPTELVLAVYEKLCLLFDCLPYRSCIFGKPEEWKIAGYYSILLFVALCYRRLTKLKIIAAVLAAFLLLVLRFPYGLQITILDVGQGDGACIQAQNGETYLIDCGSSTKKQLAKYQLIPFLKSSGISEIDYVFLTHMDEDHISAIKELLEMQLKKETSIRVNNIVIPNSVKEDETWKELQKSVKKADRKLYIMSEGDSIENGKLKIQCVFPTKSFYSEEGNENSLVLSVSYESFTMLFTGDIEGAGEEEMMKLLKERERAGSLEDYEIVKVSHHGSKNSSPTEMLELLQAETAIISCGKNNRYGHPHKELLERIEKQGMKWYATQDTGAIMIWTDGTKWNQRVMK